MLYDIVVIGGGPAGISAALRCARCGLKTVLATDRPVLGGNSSSEIRVWTRGATGAGNLFAEEMGTLGELKLQNLHVNPQGNVYRWDDVLLNAVLGESNLTLWLNLPITHVCVQDGVIRSVSGVQLGSGMRCELSARMYIDCTGDGEVAFQAGVPFRTGQESRAEFGEELALATSEQAVLGSSILLQSKRTGHPVAYVPPAYAYTIEEIEGLIRRGGRIVTADMQGSDCWWFEFGGCMNTVSDNQSITIELRRIVLGIWNYIKNSGQYQADDLELEWMGTIPGKRESRRFVGEHTLTQSELQNNSFSEKGVSYGGWYMDAHPAEGIFSTEEHCTQLAVGCYEIPLACFYHGRYPNLLFSGRAASVSHMAFTSYRIMNTCALAGDACALAAAQSLQTGVPLSQLNPAVLRQRLAQEDILYSEAPSQNALAGARIRVSSEHSHTSVLTDETLALQGKVYVCLPTTNQLVHLRFYADAAVPIAYRIDTHALPSRLCKGRQVAQGKCELHGGWNDVQILLPSGDGFSMIWFEDAQGVSLALGKRLCAVAAGRKEDIHMFSPWVFWEGNYSGECVLSGYTRPYRGANAWVSQGSSAELVIQLDKPAEVSEIRLYFDPDFAAELTSSHCASWSPQHHYEARCAMPPSLVRNYTLLVDGMEVSRVRDNDRRLAVHSFSKRLVHEIALQIQDTYGGDAVVYRLLVCP